MGFLCTLLPVCVFAFSQDSVKSVSRAYAFYLRGLMADYYAQPKEALEEYLKVKNFDKNSLSARLRLAASYVKLNQYDQAVNILKEAKDLDQDSLDASVLLVLIYTAEGKNDEANEEYESFLRKAHKLNPENLKILEYLAQFKFQQGQKKDAVLLYRQILRENPQYADGYFWLGYMFEDTGRRASAIICWKKTLLLSPQHPDALNSLGYVYAEEGRNLKKAERMLKKALEVSPQNPAYLDSLGWIYFHQGDYIQAEQYVHQASMLLKDPVIFDHLGDIYQKLGETQKAIESWEVAFSFETPDKQKIAQKIEGLKNARHGF